MNQIPPQQKRKDPFRTIQTDSGPVNFYRIELADEILHPRFMEAEIQEVFIRTGVGEEFLSSMIDLLMERAMAATDLKILKKEAIAIAQNLEGRVKQLSEMSLYEDLACVYFMMEGEPNEVDKDWSAKKKAIWRAHPEERDFFILQAFRRTGNYQTLSDRDILNAFQAAEERVNQLPMLPEPSQV